MDDNELATLLGETLAEEDMSPRVAADALSAFRWLRMDDDDLAELTFDSAEAPLAGVRGSRARGGQEQRQLRYESDDLVIDCEVAEDALLGQLTPPTPASVVVRSPDGSARALDTDDEGRFIADPAPAGPISIACLRTGRRPVVTRWLVV